jgi:hypothetical protein
MGDLPKDVTDFLFGLRSRPMTPEQRVLADVANILNAYAAPLPDFPGRQDGTGY